jgi:hypothetical protein
MLSRQATKEAITMSAIAGLFPWEMADWISPTGEDLPGWLEALRQTHADALTQYQAAVSGAVDVAAEVEAAQRAWRLDVRAAVAAGRTPPERGQATEVGAAQVEVAREDAVALRDELAVTACEVLDQLRGRVDDLGPHFARFSPELHTAIGRGPDGLREPERERIARQRNAESEPAIANVAEEALDAISA